MKTAQPHRRLGDICRFETRVSRLRTDFKATLAGCVGMKAFEEGVARLNDRITLLETKHGSDVKALTARCERLEKELAALKEVNGQAGTKATQVGPKPPGMGIPPPQDSALSRSFAGKGLETMDKGVEALKQWTGKGRATIVYDSKKDVFTAGGLFNNVKDKANIAVIGFTTDGDVFGGFYSRAVTEQEEKFYDPTIFAFSFESHGRCATPQKFVLKEEWKELVNVKFWKNDSRGFVIFWMDCRWGFFLGNESSKSNCWNLSSGLEGLADTTLTGKTGYFYDTQFYHCTRLVAIQLE